MHKSQWRGLFLHSADGIKTDKTLFRPNGEALERLGHVGRLGCLGSGQIGFECRQQRQQGGLDGIDVKVIAARWWWRAWTS